MLEVYFKVGFIMGIVSISLQVLRIMFSSYPRIETKNIAMDMFGFCVSVGFFVWLCVIKFTVI